jgi:D-arabinose 1-dehydrogenase-like Zn-dependent alcohol dehydrogenase
MSNIKKVLITEFGGEDKLTIVEDNIPEPMPGEVQIAVEYSIVSGSDVNMRRGTYPFQKKAPLTPGYRISVPIKATFKLQDIKDAHREYASSSGVGSTIIEVSQQR